MKTVAIIGMGLIGGSLGQALRKSRAYHVIGLARKSSTVQEAKRCRAFHEGSTDFSMASRANLVVLATPVAAVVPTLQTLLPFLKPGTVITDVGSAKGNIMSDAQAVLKTFRHLSFVGSHPLAGSHRTGVAAARPDLFNGSVCVVVSSSRASARPVMALWKAVGAKTVLMTADAHDEALAVTSHLPHLIAHALMSQLRTHSKRQRLSRLLAGSFRDMTRVAAADPTQWAQIFHANGSALRRALQEFRRQLDHLEKNLDHARLPKLLNDSARFRAPLFHGK